MNAHTPIPPEVALSTLLSLRQRPRPIQLRFEAWEAALIRPSAEEEARLRARLPTLPSREEEWPFFRALGEVMARRGHPLSLPRAAAALEQLLGPLGAPLALVRSAPPTAGRSTPPSDPLPGPSASPAGSFAVPLRMHLRAPGAPQALAYILVIRDRQGHLVFDLHRLSRPHTSGEAPAMAPAIRARLFQALYAYLEGSARSLRPRTLRPFRREDLASGLTYGLEDGRFFLVGRGQCDPLPT